MLWQYKHSYYIIYSSDHQQNVPCEGQMHTWIGWVIIYE